MRPTRGDLCAPGQGDSPHIWSCCRWGLPCRPCHHERGALLPHHFTLARNSRQRAVGSRQKNTSVHSAYCLPRTAYCSGRYLSVALSVGLLRLGVTKHRALCSSDFPHRRVFKARRRGRRCSRDASYYTVDRGHGFDVPSPGIEIFVRKYASECPKMTGSNVKGRG